MSWKESLTDSVNLYKEVMPATAITCIVASILAGLMGNFTMPMFLAFAGENTFAADVLIIIPLLIVGAPLIWLAIQLSKSKESLQYDLKEHIFDTIRSDNNDRDRDTRKQLRSKVENITENKKAWVVRVFAFSVAAFGSVVIVYYSYVFAPAGWEFACVTGGILSALVSSYVGLASVITCFVDMRKDVNDIETEITAYNELQLADKSSENEEGS